MSGNNVSHAQNKTKRRFMPNLKVRRYWSDALKRTIVLTVSVKGMRVIDKLGIDEVLVRMNKRQQQEG